MPVAVEQVRNWLMLGKTGHALARYAGRYFYTACNKVTPNGTLTKSLPGRICGKCRAALLEAVLVPSNERKE